MSVEPARLEEMGQELGEALSESPAHRRFEEARAAVQNDPHAQEKIAEFERLRDEFNAARQMGEATQSDVEHLKEVQSELNSIPVMEEFLNAQEALQRQLEAVNEAVSAPLAVDFGGEAGGCCHD